MAINVMEIGSKRPEGRDKSVSSRFLTVFMMMLFFAMLLLKENVQSTSSSHGDIVDVKPTYDRLDVNYSKSKSDAVQVSEVDEDKSECQLDCESERHEFVEEFHDNELDNRKILLKRAKDAREKMIEEIRTEYGSYFDAIFMDPENEGKFRGFEAADPEEDSMERMKRRLQIKVLSLREKIMLRKVMSIQERKRQHEGLCRNQCHHNASAPLLPVAFPTHDIRYVWANGGHSSSAGHGNLYNESYTAVLERDVKPIFAAIGIEFEARNHAMGGTSSGLEISMCYEQIFGSDVDFTTWDYGMTDGRNTMLLFHYGYRAALSGGYPAISGINADGYGRDQRLRDLGHMGMPSFYRSSTALKQATSAFPDSGLSTEEEIRAMPPSVRNAKCNGDLERGEPYCKTEKYTKIPCPGRSFQANWHPGWKLHALDGHMLAFFLSQTLVDALEELVANPNLDSSALLKELKNKEKDAFEAFKKADLPKDKNMLYGENAEIDLDLLIKGRSICRTGRLPAMSRYLGYTTNTDKIGGATAFQFEQYDTGIEMGKATLARREEEERDVMPLTFELGRSRDKTCPFRLTPDHKDFFYTHSKQGVMKMTFPNEKEKLAYKYNRKEMKGLIILILPVCDWGKCKPGDLRVDAIQQGDMSITVNGKTVSSVTLLGKDAVVLKHKDGVYWQPSANDDYQIGVEVLREDDSYFRISSVVIY